MSRLFSAIVRTDGMSRLAPSDQPDARERSSRQRPSSDSSAAARPRASRPTSIFKALLASWIGGLAALIFMTAVFLAIFCVIGWWHVAYIYAGIKGVTIFLAGLAYLLADDE